MTCRPSSVSALRAGAPSKKLRPLALTLQLAFAGSLIAGAGWGAASAHAQPTPTAASASRAYQIPAGPLSAVLTRFCTEAGVFLAGSTELTQDRRSAGLRGSYTPEAGIKVLLAGTGLEAVRQDNGSYALRPAAVSETTASAAASSAQTLPVVMVHAPRETAIGPATGYQATQSATATKTDTALMDTPASLSIVTQAQIEAQATRTTGEALRYSAGVAAEFDGVDSRFDTIAIRGFNAGSTTWLDGTKLEGGLGAGNNWTLPQIDPFALERIELLKGPASVLYGQVIPGGMLNMVSKRPDTVVQRNVELTVGSHGQHRAGIDLGGPLGDSGAAWRLVGLGSETGSQVDFAQRRRLLLAPSIKLPLGGRGDVTLLASVQRDRGGSDYTWLPAYGTLRPNPNGPIPSSRFIGEPAFNRYDRDQDLFGWSLQYALTDALTLRQNVRAQRLTSVLEAVNSDMYAWDDPAETQDWDWRTLDRYATRGVGKARVLGADTQLQWKGSTASVQHTVLAGVDHYRNTFTAQRSAADMADGAGALDLYAPVYGAAIAVHSRL